MLDLALHLRTFDSRIYQWFDDERRSPQLGFATYALRKRKEIFFQNAIDVQYMNGIKEHSLCTKIIMIMRDTADGR